jgi:hypothetical protein
MTEGAYTTCFEQNHHSLGLDQHKEQAISLKVSLIITLLLKLVVHTQLGEVTMVEPEYNVLKQAEKCQKLPSAEMLSMTHSICRMSLKRMASVLNEKTFHRSIF